MRARLVGSLTGLASVAALGAAMLPLRSHLAVSTTALVLVIPVVVAAAIGGFVAGLAVVAAGFLVFDFFFIPPYGTLNVGSAQNWVALFVYLVVMLLVARVVARLDTSRVEAERGGAAARRLSELSELLVGERPVGDLLTTIVGAIHTAFAVPSVALLVLDDGDAARRGDRPASRSPPTSSAASSRARACRSASGSRPARRASCAPSRSSPRAGRSGSSRCAACPRARPTARCSTTFANDAALAIERARLSEQALRTQLLEEVDRFRQGLMGAVSHDLRTPLATIKVASSTLSNRWRLLDEAQATELYRLIEVESDRLTRLVTNLLDMTRIEAGVFTVHRAPVAPAQLVKEAVAAMGPSLEGLDVVVDVPSSLPEVDVDALLVGQVIINLLDNAARHSPERRRDHRHRERRGRDREPGRVRPGPGDRPGDARGRLRPLHADSTPAAARASG